MLSINLLPFIRRKARAFAVFSVWCGVFVAAACAGMYCTTGASVVSLSVADLAKVTGGLCYGNATSNCEGTNNGCADGDCEMEVLGNMIIFTCPTVTGRQSLATDYNNATQQGSGLDSTETWEPIYCYVNTACLGVCQALPFQKFFECIFDENLDYGPLIWPTTATGNDCNKGE